MVFETMLELEYKKELFRFLVVLGIIVIGFFILYDIYVGKYWLIPIRIFCIILLIVSLNLDRNKQEAKAIGLALFAYFIIQTAYLIAYISAKEAGVWIPLFPAIFAIWAPLPLSIMAYFYVIFLYTFLIHYKTGLPNPEKFFSVYRVFVATTGAYAIVIASERTLKKYVLKLKEQAERDHLTQLYTRKKLEEFLSREINRAKRYNTKFSALLIDLDNFKIINDTLGHLEGDKVLKQVADIISSNIRKTDFPARYGGDEFIVILPETDLEGAKVVANKLAKAIKEKTPVTASIGAAQYDGEEDFSEFLKKIDDLCYTAKRNGKGSIAC